jgi:hypothetical protein
MEWGGGSCSISLPGPCTSAGARPSGRCSSSHSWFFSHLHHSPSCSPASLPLGCLSYLELANTTLTFKTWCPQSFSGFSQCGLGIFLVPIISYLYGWLIDFMVLGIELKTSCLLDEHSATPSTPLVLFLLACFSDRVLG